MRIDSPIPQTGGAVSAGQLGGAAPEQAQQTPALAVGDEVNVRVVEVRDGTATLRLENGMELQARLEDGVNLPTGANVRLLVTGRNDGTLTMSLALPGQAQAAPTQTADPATQTLLRQLSSLGIKPDAAMLETMKQAMAQFPQLTAGQAALVAVHKLPLEPSTMTALQAALGGEADTASLLEGLKALAEGAQTTQGVQVVQQGEAQAQPAVQPQSTTQTTTPLPATLPEQAAQVAETSVLPQTQPSESTQPATVIIQAPELSEDAQADTIRPPVTDNTAPPKAAQGTENTASQQTQAAESATTQQSAQSINTAAKTARPPEFTEWLSRALSTGGGAKAPTASQLAGSPMLEGLSSRSLAVMAESLGRIADSMPELEDERALFESISRFAEELFLDVEREPDAGGKLKAAREELYVKLSYFKDAVASSSAASKGVVLEQTQKLMEHTKLLTELDRFVYMQVPVTIGEQRQNAELYIYKNNKKNGSRRIDPEDVKILLALDLQHMGHLEAFIEVKLRSVSLRLEVESDEVAEVFRGSTATLNELLDEIGYKFANSTCVTKKSETTIESALLALVSFEQLVSKGIDCRA